MTATVTRLAQQQLPGVDRNLPTVACTIDDDTWDVALDVSGQVNLVEFFDAITHDPALRDAMRRLMFNRVNASVRADALNEFTSSPAIRKALTVTLSPGDAETLGILLDDASREPFPRCQHYAGGGGCNYFVTDKNDDELCPMHLTEQQERRDADARDTGPWS